MKNIILSAILLSISVNSITQDLTGVWKGRFNESVSTDSYTSFEIEFKKRDSGMVVLTKTCFLLQEKKYFTVCISKMKIDKQKTTLVITEMEKVNSNTPEWIRDCFQKHTLYYIVKNGKEFLKGYWESANHSINCGKGITELEKEAAPAPNPEMKSPEN